MPANLTSPPNFRSTTTCRIFISSKCSRTSKTGTRKKRLNTTRTRLNASVCNKLRRKDASGKSRSVSRLSGILKPLRRQDVTKRKKLKEVIGTVTTILTTRSLLYSQKMKKTHELQPSHRRQRRDKSTLGTISRKISKDSRSCMSSTEPKSQRTSRFWKSKLK